MLALKILAVFAVLGVVFFLLNYWLERRATTPPKVVCSEYDRLSVDQSLFVIHAYVQVSAGKEINLAEGIRELKVIYHPPKPKNLIEGWAFYPFFGTTGKQSTEKKYLKKKSMLGFVGVNKEKKQLTIVFRNSRTITDWITNFGLSLKKGEKFVYSGFFHSGYVDVFHTCLDEINKILFPLCQEIKDIGGYDIILTGHSMGGGLATLMTTYLIEHKFYRSYFGYHNIKLITFAAPYIAVNNSSHDFTRWINRHVKYIRCFEYSADIAPGVSCFVAIQAQKNLDLGVKEEGILYPVCPAKSPSKLKHLGGARVNIFGAHNIPKYRESIYKNLGIPYENIYEIYGIKK